MFKRLSDWVLALYESFLQSKELIEGSKRGFNNLLPISGSSGSYKWDGVGCVSFPRNDLFHPETIVIEVEGSLISCGDEQIVIQSCEGVKTFSFPIRELEYLELLGQDVKYLRVSSVELKGWGEHLIHNKYSLKFLNGVLKGMIFEEDNFEEGY